MSETLLAVLLVTAAAVVLLFRRGLTGGSSSGAEADAGSGAAGVDPLLAAVPLLAALVVCIAVLRLYPIPLAGLALVATCFFEMKSVKANASEARAGKDEV